MLSAAKHLAADRGRPFAEFTLSATNVLSVTRCGCSNCQELFFTIEPCLVIFHQHNCTNVQGKTDHLYEARNRYLQYTKSR
jgi:hypothetical protein